MIISIHTFDHFRLSQFAHVQIDVQENIHGLRTDSTVSFKGCRLRRPAPWSRFAISFVALDSRALCQILRVRLLGPYRLGPQQHPSHSEEFYWGVAMILKRVCPRKFGQQVFDHGIETNGHRCHVRIRKFECLTGVREVSAPTPSAVTVVRGRSQEKSLELARVAIQTRKLEELNIVGWDAGRTDTGTAAVMDLTSSNTSATDAGSGSSGSSRPPSGCTRISSIGIGVSHTMRISAKQFRHEGHVIEGCRQMGVWNRETAPLVDSIANLQTGGPGDASQDL